VRVNVTIGKPVVKGISPDSCWIADQVSYTVRTSAPVGKVVRWGIKWEGGSSFEESSDSTFTHAYPASGRKALLAYAVNDENVSSDTVGDSVIVKPGLPSVTVIATSEPMSALYIKDQVRYTIKGQDQNDYIDSILVSWNGDTVFEELIQAKGDSAAVTHAFAREDSGSRQIRFRAKDPDGIVDDSVLNVSVLSGAPVVDSLTPRTVWVNDNNPVVIHSSDTNGYVVKRWVDWDRNGTWDDSLTKNDQNTHISIDTFYHAWDTAFGGKFATYWVRIMDEDSVMSAVKTCTIFVRMGRPVLKGGASYGLPIQWKADTMFYIYTGGNPSFAVDTIDTNGVIQKFYWDIGRDGINDSTAVPFWSQYVPPNMATPFRITSKDDDGLKSLAFDFVVFPDAPPDTPLVYNEVPFGDSVTLRWSRYDLKDGKDATLFGIKIDYVGNNPTNLLIEQTGSKFGWDGTRYTYKFKPSNPSFSYRIYAKDARGSVTESLVQYYAP